MSGRGVASHSFPKPSSAAKVYGAEACDVYYSILKIVQFRILIQREVQYEVELTPFRTFGTKRDFL